jgi:predicted Fe-Mo cluster-binding NifX family protein
MKLCFPVVQDQGLDSVVYGHFGSAPRFLVVDAATGQTSLVDNSDKVHEHGACNPARSVAGLDIEGIVVGGIGRGALISLNRAGFRVFQAQGELVRDNLTVLQGAGLQEFAPGSVCGGHSHAGQDQGGGCCH